MRETEFSAASRREKEDTKLVDVTYVPMKRSIDIIALPECGFVISIVVKGD